LAWSSWRVPSSIVWVRLPLAPLVPFALLCCCSLSSSLALCSALLAVYELRPRRLAASSRNAHPTSSLSLPSLPPRLPCAHQPPPPVFPLNLLPSPTSLTSHLTLGKTLSANPDLVPHHRRPPRVSTTSSFHHHPRATVPPAFHLADLPLPLLASSSTSFHLLCSRCSTSLRDRLELESDPGSTSTTTSQSSLPCARPAHLLTSSSSRLRLRSHPVSFLLSSLFSPPLLPARLPLTWRNRTTRQPTPPSTAKRDSFGHRPAQPRPAIVIRSTAEHHNTK
jgi:hypothetical protein